VPGPVEVDSRGVVTCKFYRSFIVYVLGGLYEEFHDFASIISSSTKAACELLRYVVVICHIRIL
jgi:hypothetical protein